MKYYTTDVKGKQQINEKVHFFYIYSQKGWKEKNVYKVKWKVFGNTFKPCESIASIEKKQQKAL